MPIPELDEGTRALPPGEHEATLAEVRERFATNRQRKKLQSSLERVVAELRAKGVKTIWVDGSYVTATRQLPTDVDVVYRRPKNSDPRKWGWVSPQNRAALYRSGVDLLGHTATGRRHGRPQSIVNYFQQDRDDRPKGIIRLVEESDD